ncbi:hypothetical protein H0H93_016272 [Arthromyces matolae]|nr:hypothetical protein H0H93_016272 [Arthromyces matolae]
MTFRVFSMMIIASLLTVARGLALNLSKRDVFVPPVTYPHAGTVWKINQHHNITWDTSNHPVNITNKVGLIFLRKAGSTTPRS